MVFVHNNCLWKSVEEMLKHIEVLFVVDLSKSDLRRPVFADSRTVWISAIWYEAITSLRDTIQFVQICTNHLITGALV